MTLEERSDLKKRKGLKDEKNGKEHSQAIQNIESCIKITKHKHAISLAHHQLQYSWLTARWHGYWSRDLRAA